MNVTLPEPGSLEAECPGGIDWAFYVLGECIRTPRDKVSITFGILSICAWLLFAIPQIVENYKKKIPDAAVSEFLLIFWILGDSLNFIGSIMTNQLFFQVFETNDLNILFSFIIYHLFFVHFRKLLHCILLR